MHTTQSFSLPKWCKHLYPIIWMHTFHLLIVKCDFTKKISFVQRLKWILDAYQPREYTCLHWQEKLMVDVRWKAVTTCVWMQIRECSNYYTHGHFNFLFIYEVTINLLMAIIELYIFVCVQVCVNEINQRDFIWSHTSKSWLTKL